MVKPLRRQAGFTLVEVMVAFTILALCVGVVTVIFGNGLRVAAAADGYTRAIAVAESKIAEFSLSDNLQPGQAQGMAGDIQWQTLVLPWVLDPSAANGLPAPDYYRISVRAAWGEGQTLALETIRLAPRTRPQAGDGSDDEGGDNQGGDGQDGTDGGGDGAQ